MYFVKQNEIKINLSQQPLERVLRHSTGYTFKIQRHLYVHILCAIYASDRKKSCHLILAIITRC